MADYTISIADDHRAVAIGKALDAYNARNPPITGSQFLQRIVDGQIDNLVGSYLTTRVTKVDFLDRFTVEERVAIREAARTDGVVQDYLELLNAVSVVDLTSSRTTSGVAALEAAGLIAAGRGAAILAL